MKRIRVKIDGEWSVEDFAQFFSSTGYLYAIFAAVDLETELKPKLDPYFDLPHFLSYAGALPSSARRRFAHALVRAQAGSISLASPEFLKAPASSLMPDEYLKVRRCFYASPGGIDLVGIGQAVGHVKDLILKMVDLKTTGADRELKTQILEQDLKAAGLKNLRDEIGILKELGYAESDIRRMIAASRPAVGSLANLADQGQLTFIEEVENNDG
jgi:hypothetical protein